MSEPWRLRIKTHPAVAAAIWQTQEIPLTLHINGSATGDYRVTMVTYHAEDDADVDLVQVMP